MIPLFYTPNNPPITSRNPLDARKLRRYSRSATIAWLTDGGRDIPRQLWSGRFQLPRWSRKVAKVAWGVWFFFSKQGYKRHDFIIQIHIFRATYIYPYLLRSCWFRQKATFSDVWYIFFGSLGFQVAKRLYRINKKTWRIHGTNGIYKSNHSDHSWIVFTKDIKDYRLTEKKSFNLGILGDLWVQPVISTHKYPRVKKGCLLRDFPFSGGPTLGSGAHIQWHQGQKASACFRRLGRNDGDSGIKRTGFPMVSYGFLWFPMVSYGFPKGEDSWTLGPDPLFPEAVFSNT